MLLLVFVAAVLLVCLLVCFCIVLYTKVNALNWSRVVFVSRTCDILLSLVLLCFVY